jgi:hypothetical protein
VRYWCCNHDTIDVNRSFSLFKVNANYNESTRNAVNKSIPLNSFVSCDDCYSYLDVSANFELLTTGTAIQGGYLVPDTVKRVKASLSGNFDAKVQLTVTGGSEKVTVEREILPKTKLTTFTAYLGCVPVKIDFSIEMKAQIEADITVNLTQPLVAMAKIAGGAEVGGVYDSGNFTEIATYNLNYEYSAPDFSQVMSAIANSSMNADMRLTLIPVVHMYVIVYYVECLMTLNVLPRMVADVLPIEIELRPYVGIELDKYATGVTAGRNAPCDQSTTSDLWYAMYYGMNSALRIARPITPTKWKVHDNIIGVVDGLVLGLCRTADDAHSVGFSLKVAGVGISASYPVIPAGSVVAKQNVAACDATSWYCDCVRDAGGGTQTGVHANPIYLVRYPSAWCPNGTYTGGIFPVVRDMNQDQSSCGNGYAQILSKTRVPQVTGCLTPGGLITNTAAATPPAPAPTTTTQSIVFNGLADASAYTGAIKMAYEFGWSHGLGLASISGSSVSHAAGVTVTSSAARRAVTVTFEASTNSQFTGTAPTTGATATNLNAGIAAVIAADTTTYAGVTAPAISTMTVRPATVTTSATTATSTTSASPSSAIPQVLVNAILGILAIWRTL